MEDYEAKKFIAKADNIMLSGLLDVWVEEEDVDNGCAGTLRTLGCQYHDECLHPIPVIITPLTHFLQAILLLHPHHWIT